MELRRDFVVVVRFALAELSATKEGPMELILVALKGLCFVLDLLMACGFVVDFFLYLRDEFNRGLSS